MTTAAGRATLAAAAIVLGAAAGVAQPRRPPAAAEYTAVTVRAGETCAAVARRVYRAPSRTDVIHQFNPGVCPPQRRLTAGLVLRLPRRLPPAPRPAPVAFVTALNNTVRVQTQAAAPPRPARADDPLFRGTRVSTEARSSAELTFQDETQLRLDESTLVVILGDTSSRVRRAAAARDTTLVNGSLRAFLGALAHGPTVAPPVITIVGRRPRPPRRPPRARPTQVSISTAGGRATLRDGESQLTVAAGARPTTTLTVYRGSGQLRAGAQTVNVPEGFGARAEAGERVAPVHRLPVAPAWRESPPRVILSETPTLAGRYAAGAPPADGAVTPPPVAWRVQVARDAAFSDIERDERVPLAVDSLDGPLSPGVHHVRVSAVDADRFEGPFGAVATVVAVSTTLAPTDVPYREALRVPAGATCSVDGAAVPPDAATVLDRLRPHALRCAPVGDPAHAEEVAVDRAVRSPYRVTATLFEADPAARRGRVRVRLVDRRDVPYAEPRLVALGRGGLVTVDADGAFDEATGEWTVPVRWRAGTAAFALRLGLAGDEAADTPELALPPDPPPAPAPDGFAQRLSLRGEGLYAAMLSEYQRNADADVAGVFMGNAKALSDGVAGSLRLGLDLRRPPAGSHGVRVGAEVFAHGVLFPRGAGGAGVAALLGAGLRVSPYDGAAQPWVSAGAGLVSTGGLLRVGVDVGLGVDFRLTRALSIGPTVRYLHVVEPDADAPAASLAEDARVIEVGVGLTLRVPGVR